MNFPSFNVHCIRQEQIKNALACFLLSFQNYFHIDFLELLENCTIKYLMFEYMVEQNEPKFEIYL